MSGFAATDSTFGDTKLTGSASFNWSDSKLLSLEELPIKDWSNLSECNMADDIDDRLAFLEGS